MTIATNMAGRGTDYLLGGSWQAEVAALENQTAGQIEKIKANWQVRHDAVLEQVAYISSVPERHESRRIDNQLRGRAGRQGDAGSPFLSVDGRCTDAYFCVRRVVKQHVCDGFKTR